MPQSTIFAAHRAELRDVLGPLVSLPTAAADGGYAVIRSVIPSGTVIPLHSHADRETIVVVEGEVEVWMDSWRTYGAGDLVEIAPDVPHALRNAGSDETSLVLVTTATMARFFDEIGVGQDVPAMSPERMEHFFRTSAAYGYWNGSPEHQAAIGISLPGA